LTLARVASQRHTRTRPRHFYGLGTRTPRTAPRRRTPLPRRTPPLTHLRLPGYGKRSVASQPSPEGRTEHFSTANLSPTASGSAAAAAYPTDLRVTRTRTEHGCFGYIWLSTLPRKTVAQCCESFKFRTRGPLSGRPVSKPFGHRLKTSGPSTDGSQTENTLMRQKLTS